MSMGGSDLEIVQQVLSPATETASDVWNRLVGDRLSAWRIRNAMKIHLELHEEAKRLGLKIRPEKIPERYAVAWFEEASKQDEEELQVMFARLLARAASEDAEGAPDRRLIDVLARFTPEDAEVFQCIYSEQPFPNAGHYSEFGPVDARSSHPWPRDWFDSMMTHRFGDCRPRAVEHLASLSCLSLALRFDRRHSQINPRPRFDGTIDIAEVVKDQTKLLQHVEGTSLGRALYDQVKP